MQLEGKTAVVTGAARGIGRAIAETLARCGARVVLVDVGRLGDRSEAGWDYKLASSDDLEEATEAIRQRGGEVAALEVDVTDAASCREMIAQACERFGSLDLLVNNAGLVKMGFIAEYAEADWERIFAVNVKGVFLASQAAIAGLSEDGGGAIVNIASIAGKRGYAGLGAYCSSKFAVVGLTQAMAQELAGQGIRVNAVCPGLLATAMWMDHLSHAVGALSGKAPGREAFEDYVEKHTPLGREQTPEDVAEAVVYLARADNVTGVALNVAGGTEMW